jgi:hypothetical protein
MQPAVVWRWDAAEAFGATAPDQNPAVSGPSPTTSASRGRCLMWRRGCSKTGIGSTTPKLGDISRATRLDSREVSTPSPMLEATPSALFILADYRRPLTTDVPFRGRSCRIPQRPRSKTRQRCLTGSSARRSRIAGICSSRWKRLRASFDRGMSA